MIQYIKSPFFGIIYKVSSIQGVPEQFQTYQHCIVYLNDILKRMAAKPVLQGQGSNDSIGKQVLDLIAIKNPYYGHGVNPDNPNQPFIINDQKDSEVMKKIKADTGITSAKEANVIISLLTQDQDHQGLSDIKTFACHETSLYYLYTDTLPHFTTGLSSQSIITLDVSRIQNMALYYDPDAMNNPLEYLDAFNIDFLTIAHELVHSLHFASDFPTMINVKSAWPHDGFIENIAGGMSYAAHLSYTERPIAKERGLPVRLSYYVDFRILAKSGLAIAGEGNELFIGLKELLLSHTMLYDLKWNSLLKYSDIYLGLEMRTFFLRCATSKQDAVAAREMIDDILQIIRNIEAQIELDMRDGDMQSQDYYRADYEAKIEAIVHENSHLVSSHEAAGRFAEVALRYLDVQYHNLSQSETGGSYIDINQEILHDTIRYAEDYGLVLMDNIPMPGYDQLIAAPENLVLRAQNIRAIKAVGPSITDINALKNLSLIKQVEAAFMHAEPEKRIDIMKERLKFTSLSDEEREEQLQLYEELGPEEQFKTVQALEIQQEHEVFCRNLGSLMKQHYEKIRFSELSLYDTVDDYGIRSVMDTHEQMMKLENVADIGWQASDISRKIFMAQSQQEGQWEVVPGSLMLDSEDILHFTLQRTDGGCGAE